MPAQDAVVSPNQIAFPFMEDTEAATPAGPRVAPDVTGVDAGHALGSNFVPALALVALAGTAALAIIASGAAKPLLLALMSVLATAGLFLVFALLAGHMRLTERVSDDDIVRSLADSHDDGLLVVTHDGTPVYNNRQYELLIGRASGGRIHTLESAFTGEPKATAAVYRLSRAALRGESYAEEFEIGAAGASRRLMRVACRPFHLAGKDGELGPLSVWKVTDISEARAKQAAHLESLESSISLFDKVPAGLLAVAADGTLKYANATFLSWLGTQAGAPAGAPRERRLKLSDIVPADCADLLRAHSRQPGATRSPVDLDARGENGRVIPMRFFVRQEADGTLLVAAQNRDTEAALVADMGDAEVRFARFLQSAPFGIATVGEDGRIMTMNAAFARMTDGTAATIDSSAAGTLCQAASKESRAEFENGLKLAFSGKTLSTPIEITAGSEGQYSRRVYMAPLAATGSARQAAILYVLDATEQKALEAKFAQSSKMEAVGKLAGGIAHDFNNVLTAIIGFSDLLLQTHRPADPAYKDIMNIRSSANRAAGLVAKLLAFSRRQTLQSEPLQLGEVITDLAPLLNRSIGEKIPLKISTARDLWYVKADKTQFEQVIINLAVNARDAMPDGGSLSIRSRNLSERESLRFKGANIAPGEYVLIEVEDTGTGMSREVQEKIFEPFFTTKGVGKGTGLGLATVYGIVKQSGGYIYANSEVGRGTTFEVLLPRHIPESEIELQSQKQNKVAKAVDLTGTGRVLLVEDEDIVRSFAVRALKRQGYEVLEASSGVEALEVMERIGGKVDIVVSDVVMPEMDGPTLLKNLRMKNPQLKIIFVSGYPHEAFETSLDKNQQFAFLPKPFSLPQLAAKVKEELAR